MLLAMVLVSDVSNALELPDDEEAEAAFNLCDSNAFSIAKDDDDDDDDDFLFFQNPRFFVMICLACYYTNLSS